MTNGPVKNFEGLSINNTVVLTTGNEEEQERPKISQDKNGDNIKKNL